MAKRTKDLPIYKASYELVKLITDSARHFPRDFRSTLGSTLNKESVDLVVCVYRANAAQEKSVYIDVVLEKLQVLEMLMQMAFDLRLIAPGVFAKSIDLTEGIGKQAGGWKKYDRQANIAPLQALHPQSQPLDAPRRF